MVDYKLTYNAILCIIFYAKYAFVIRKNVLQHSWVGFFFDLILCSKKEKRLFSNN